MILKPEARERLAKISGIVLAYPDLKLQIEGYTDSIGSDEYNQTLSDKRAEAVRDYLVSQGVSMNNVAAQGMGKADPVADNSTAAGRQVEPARRDDRIGRRDRKSERAGWRARTGTRHAESAVNSKGSLFAPLANALLKVATKSY